MLLHDDRAQLSTPAPSQNPAPVKPVECAPAFGQVLVRLSEKPAEGGILTDIAASATASAHEIDRDRGLVRAIGPFAFSASIVNSVVGAGIFALPAAMAATVGALAPLAYVACAIAMGAVVICCAEAGSRLPTSGGLYGSVEAAFGPLAGFVAGVLLWLSCVLASGGISAALADATGAMFPALAHPAARATIIIVVLGGLAVINITGVRTASRFISAGTLVKLIPLGIFVLVGAFAVSGTNLSFDQAPAEAGSFGRAVILALFAFCGMETALASSGEVAEPSRNVPRALIGGMLFVAVLYIAIQLVAQGLLGADLAASKTPLADGMRRVSPLLGDVVLVGALLSMLIWLATDLLGAPRILFAFARDGLLPKQLGRVHPRTHVPHVAIVTHTVLAMAMALTNSFIQLAILSTLATAALYFAACAAAWVLRRRDIAVAGPPLRFRVLPAAVLIAMLSMIVIVAQAKWAEIIGLVAAMIGSCLLYFVARALRPR